MFRARTSASFRLRSGKWSRIASICASSHTFLFCDVLFYFIFVCLRGATSLRHPHLLARLVARHPRGGGTPPGDGGARGAKAKDPTHTHSEFPHPPHIFFFFNLYMCSTARWQDGRTGRSTPYIYIYMYIIHIHTYIYIYI